LSMRGGVSLAVWIGGAVAEIDALRWDLAPGHEPDTTMGKVARAVGTTAVEIDVISGTSAGGLNGVVLGTAMANGTSVEGLRHVWLHTADLAALMRPGGWKRHPSILDSEQFLRRACAAICVMGQPRAVADGPPAPELPRLEAYFPVTSVVPATTTAWADPLAPVSERRVGGWIWLHHPSPPEDALGPPLPNTATSDFTLAPVDTPEHRAQVDALALTICSTAAFPVAFAPTRIAADVLPKRVRFPDGRRPDPLFLYDGGVVDNMPVGRAVSAISRAPANGPTERVLVYLHPSPGANRGAADPDLAELEPHQRPAPVDVARSAVNVLTGKSLVDDLRGLEEHYRTVRWHLRDRAAALATPPGDARDEAAIRATVAAHDAERLASLLWDPTPHLEALGPDGLQDGWLSDVGGERQQLWVRALTDLIRTGGLALRPWSGVIRTASRLIEWARWLEESGSAPPVSSTKSGIHALRAGAFREASELDRRTLLSLPEAPPTDIAAGATEVVDRRRQVLVARETHLQVQDAWAILARDAIDLLGHHTASGAAAEIDAASFEDALPAALAARLSAVASADAELVLRRLDDDLLALFGEKYIGLTGNADRVDLLASRLEKIRA
ncbi:MAG TPA: patatin-like phospholipase family protein, partial [Iamia sp.]|nr:patatin-like phospholipase family protein [Iamia sp.]